VKEGYGGESAENFIRLFSTVIALLMKRIREVNIYDIAVSL